MDVDRRCTVCGEKYPYLETFAWGVTSSLPVVRPGQKYAHVKCVEGTEKES